MSIIFSKQDAIASSIAIRAVARMKEPDIDIKLEEQLLKKAIIDFGRCVRMESVGYILRLLYSDDMDALRGDFAKVNFANCKSEDEIKNRSKILATINPALKTYIGLQYYNRLVQDINKRVSLEDYCDQVFFDEVFHKDCFSI